MHTVAVLLLLETDDPRLDPVNLSVATAKDAAALRAAVVANLSRLTRVVAVMSAAEARLMAMTHEEIKTAIGANAALRPPAGYVPPSRQ